MRLITSIMFIYCCTVYSLQRFFTNNYSFSYRPLNSSLAGTGFLNNELDWVE